MNGVDAYLAPFHFSATFSVEPPPRKSFSFLTFKSLIQSLKLVYQLYRNKEFLRSERFYNQALHAQGMGIHADAEDKYLRCLRENPKHEPALINLAAIYADLGNFEEAQTCLERAVKLRPNQYRGYYNLGLLLHAMNQAEAAVIQLKEALVRNPEHYWSLLVLAEILTESGAFEQALAYYDRALPLVPDSVPLQIRMAELFFRRGEMAEAEALFRAVVEKHRGQAESYFNLAWLILVQGHKPVEAMKLLEMAVKTRQGYKDGIFNLAIAQSIAGRFSDSIGTMNRYLTAYTQNHMGNLVEHMELLTTVNPENVKAKLYVAKRYVKEDRQEEAIAYAERIAGDHPKYLPVYEFLADAYRDMGQFKKAMKAYGDIIKLDRGHLDAHLGLSKVYGTIENYDAAIPLAARILELDPENTKIHYQYATLMAQKGELETALKHYRIVSRLDPDYPKIKKRLQMVEEDLRLKRSREIQTWS